MPENYTVKQGDYLSLLADKFGFRSYKTIWDDPANAALKSLRKNPNVLLPGDQLVIPDKDNRQESRPTDATHKFQSSADKLKLRIVFLDESAQAIVNADCQLNLDSGTTTIKTDGQGKIEQEIPRDTRAGRLTLHGEKLPEDIVLPVGVGELDPVTEVTGQIGRLNNLGYDAGVVQTPATDDAKMQFRSAVEEFQCNNHPPLTVDGICGAQTQATLLKVHGC